MRKKLVSFIFLFFSALIFNGCAAASQNDVQSLKIRVINLETILQKQVQKNQELEKRVSQLEKEVSEGMADKFVDFRAQIMKEVEDLRDQLTILSAKVEDLQFKYEELDTEYANSLKEIMNQLKALSLRVALLEKKLGIFYSPSLNATNSTTNVPTNIPITGLNANTTSASGINATFNATNTIINTPLNATVNAFANVTNATFSSINTTNATINATTNLNATNFTASNEVITNATIPANQTVQEETNLLKAKLEKLKESVLYQKGYALFEKKNYAAALKIFQEYVKQFPRGKWIGQAYFWMGECYFNQGDYEDAILSYQKLIEMPGWHPQKPLAIFRQAQAFKALGDEEAYQILLKKLIRHYPYTKEAAEARKLLNL